MSVTTTNDKQPLETRFSYMSLKNNNNNKKETNNIDQPSYNIFDAYDDITIPPQNSSNLMDPYSIHPLETLSDGYCMDLGPSRSVKEEPRRELNTMMEDLSLSPNHSNNNALNSRQRSMPYCV